MCEAPSPWADAKGASVATTADSSAPRSTAEPFLDGERPPLFILHGSGWGHGVGLCQIGAAVMGAKGYNYQEILHHYYPEATLTEWYTSSPQCPSRDDC